MVEAGVFTEALIMTLTGITIVFGVLVLLSIILYLFPRIPEATRAKTVEGREPRTSTQVSRVETPVSVQEVEEKVEEYSREELALVTAAINAFLEYKSRKLGEIELFKKFPPFMRLLPLAGIKLKAKLRVSYMGSEREVEVEEASLNHYLIKIGAKTYEVSLKLPETGERLVLELS